MSEENTTQKASLSLAEIPKSIDNALDNITGPLTKNIGQTLGDVWSLVFGGISLMANKRKLRYSAQLDIYKKEIFQAVSDIPPEKVTEPSIQITAQALENSKYCFEEQELRHMFTSLIANSMNTDYQNYVHPSFAEIIKQMSPLDAKILKLFAKRSSQYFPICEFNRITPTGRLVPLVTNVFMELLDKDPILQGKSISSLDRLGIVSVDMTASLSDSRYTKFEHHPLYQNFQKQYSEDSITINKGIVSATPHGSSFLKVCVTD